MPELQQKESDNDIVGVVARLQQEKSDITANGYRMGKHVDIDKRDTVRLLPNTGSKERYRRLRERPLSRWEIIIGVVMIVLYLAGRTARIW